MIESGSVRTSTAIRPRSRPNWSTATLSSPCAPATAAPWSNALGHSSSGEFTAQFPQVHQPHADPLGGQDRLIYRTTPCIFSVTSPAGSRLCDVRRAGHVPHEEDPAQTAAAVKAFLAP